MSSTSGTPDQISAWMAMREALEALGQQLGVVPLGVSVAAERERAEAAETEAANWEALCKQERARRDDVVARLETTKTLYEQERERTERAERHRDQVLARIEAIRAALQATS
jgi:flagellar motility protein MotE (MotC chaperone)